MFTLLRRFWKTTKFFAAVFFVELALMLYLPSGTLDAPWAMWFIGIPLIVSFAYMFVLALISPFLWLFTIVAGTIGVGVALGNNISHKAQLSPQSKT